MSGAGSRQAGAYHGDRPAWIVTAVALALVAALVFGLMAGIRPGQKVLWGDEGTYVAMTASLARDFDLRFEAADRDWALGRVPGRGAAVILQRTGSGITYSKPLLYPLVAAPSYKVLGEPGMLLVNALALLGGLLFGWIYLRRIGGGHTWLTVVTFAAAATLVPYVAWRMSESLQAGLALAGTVLVCAALRPFRTSSDRWQSILEHRWAPLAGGVLLGLLVSMRFSNALLVGGVLLAVALKRRWPRLVLASVGVGAAILLMLFLSLLALGTASPYTAERSSFDARIGYPSGDGPSTPAATAPEPQDDDAFADRPATHRIQLGLSSATLYSALYFFVGRHSGLLAYFPLALVLLVLIVRERSRVGLALALGALALALFYLLYTPHNYFGGSTFLGNRYFLVAYPVLLVGIGRLPSVRSLLAVSVVALAFGASAMLSVYRTRGLTETSQSHTAAGLFRRLPYESTAVEIQGQPQRYWSFDYVRFTDPWADAKRSHFVLHANRPTAEVLVASHRPRETMWFLARAHDGSESLLWADWRSGGELTLTAQKGQPPATLTLEPSDPWRRHRFWFHNEQVYEARLLRFSLEGPEASTAEIYYLGGGEQLADELAYAVVEATLPEVGRAGGDATARLRLTNEGRAAWRRRNVLPVSVGYHVRAEGRAVTQARRLLPADVEPGETIDLEVEIQWPDAPGDYELSIDLWLHPLRWFEETVERPVAAGTVRVDE